MFRKAADRASQSAVETWRARPENAALDEILAPYALRDGQADRVALFALAQANGLGDLSGIYGTLSPGQLFVTIANRLKPRHAAGDLVLPEVAPAPTEAPAPAEGSTPAFAPVATLPFTPAVEVGKTVFLSGQLPLDPTDPAAVLPDGVAAQTDAVLARLAEVLAPLDLGLGDVVQCRCYLTHLSRDFPAFNAAYLRHFQADRLPARTTVGVAELAFGALVEIDAVARRT